MDRLDFNSCISHEEATILSYMRDPGFAEYMLQEALEEGDSNEVAKIQRRIDEATRRKQSATYWDTLISHAEDTAQSGYNLEPTLELLNRAVAILKKAVPATA